MGAILDDDSGGSQVADNPAVLLDLHPAGGVHVAVKHSIDDHLVRVHLAGQLRAAADRQPMPTERNLSLHGAVNLQVFRAGDFALYMEARPQPSHAIVTSNWRDRCPRLRRHSRILHGWLRWLVAPHIFALLAGAKSSHFR